jgi:tRNA threonylcarbamoyladenosine biosynthesis protein TsaE
MTERSTTPSAEVAAPPDQGGEQFVSVTPDDTFEFGRKLAERLVPGDLVLLYGGLGAGKTLLTKGILEGIDYDVDEVTSPSFALVNLYKTPEMDVYHIDLWRMDGKNAAAAVGLDEILEYPNSLTIIEWSERLGDALFPNRTIKIDLKGDGDEPRTIKVRMAEDNVPKN